MATGTTEMDCYDTQFGLNLVMDMLSFESHTEFDWVEWYGLPF